MGQRSGMTPERGSVVKFRDDCCEPFAKLDRRSRRVEDDHIPADQHLAVGSRDTHVRREVLGVLGTSEDINCKQARLLSSLRIKHRPQHGVSFGRATYRDWHAFVGERSNDSLDTMRLVAAATQDDSSDGNQRETSQNPRRCHAPDRSDVVWASVRE
jgi:hypothetical protein